MPSLVVDVTAEPVDLARWAVLVPLLRQRFGALEFDDDGVVRLPDGRREGLRVIAGAAGRPGATYRLVTWDVPVDPATRVTRPVASAPTLVTVAQDDARALRLALVVPLDDSPAPQTYALEVTVPTPDAPTEAQALIAVPMPDLPRWLGRHLELQAVLDVTGPGHPVLAVTGQLRQVTGSARLQHLGRTLRAEVSVTPRGPLVFAGLVWPFVAGRIRRRVAETVRQGWSVVVDTLDPAASPEAVADELMADLGRVLADRVPV